MKKVEVEVFDDAINCPVVRMLDRRYPGVLIQGDSLKILYSMCMEAIENPQEALEIVDLIKERIFTYLQIYEKSLLDTGIELPYSKSATNQM